MKKEIIKPGTKQFRMRSDMVYSYAEKEKPSEATKEAFFRKPYALKERNKNGKDKQGI